MIASSYNNNGLNDVLVIMTKDRKAEDQVVERKGNIAQITDKNNGETVGYNIFEASKLINSLENGPVSLSEDDINKVNETIKTAGFDEKVKEESSTGFKVGFVKECVPHEDSDHLNVTQTEVDNGEVLQIVCGAANIAQGQKVVVAKPGTIMPDGMVIWPGDLRGVDSYGMICSAKELGIDGKFPKGILVLDDSAETGSTFTGLNK